ncbi:DUF1656 domain-containing protein [Allorhizobium sp. BGMRC 0089]|uniref:DUF1656 domain-containing protein n=1 Tax=Allorhizobium sonneratiae TaxID=2934936 RepID=UPI00203415D6|nr:DUF1656 domain-containing protein [Allorhizobium sonneratiae]MCM2290948.1 DUF1656 domain-containing protein [Allorhizobium sonneratiae]
MPIEIYGLYVPRLLIAMLIALVLNSLIIRLLAWFGFYRLVWHRGLFDLALYVLLVGALLSLNHWFLS